MAKNDAGRAMSGSNGSPSIPMMGGAPAINNGINPPNPQSNGLFSFLNNNPAFQSPIMPSPGFNPAPMLNPNAGFAPGPIMKPVIGVDDTVRPPLMPQILGAGAISPAQPATPIAPTADMLQKIIGAHGHGFMV